MSYSAEQKSTCFHIPAKKYSELLQALEYFFLENEAEYVDSQNVLEACKRKDLAKAFYYARWQITQDEKGICNITFLHSKLGSEHHLFSYISSFIEEDSFIEMLGEDGNLWRWRFDGKYCYEENAKKVFLGQNPMPAPPCNIGDTVYLIVTIDKDKRIPVNKPIKAYLDSVHYYSWANYVSLFVDTKALSGDYRFKFNEYNELYFSTKEEATKAIKEKMKEEEK